ncbi:MAG: hypothetical protein JO269_06440, partial [Burkholderiaceae bacterium]|nr:hypothetical protein [Burkholderiaceae bacterium]
MHLNLASLLFVPAIGLLIESEAARAEDVYILAASDAQINENRQHTLELLRAALDASTQEYGPYTLSHSNIPMLRKRILRELETGELINVSAQITSAEWEKTAIPVRIPIDRGLANFRISLIDGRRQDEFMHIDSLARLKQLAIGVGEQWATREVYEGNGMHIVTGTSNSGMYAMLMEGRFDYLPRSIDEAVHERKDLAERYPNLAIEKSFVLYTPVPRYFFVSPRAPRLAKRLRAGMEKLLANGDFDRYFVKHYGPLIAQAELCKRTIFRLNNPGLSAETPLKRK